jgi:transcriptional regulator with XRE-family HTH domain
MRIHATPFASLRKQRGLTQQKLADELGMQRTNLSDIERGRWVPGIGTCDRIAAALGVDVGVVVKAALETKRWREQLEAQNAADCRKAA